MLETAIIRRIIILDYMCAGHTEINVNKLATSSHISVGAEFERIASDSDDSSLFKIKHDADDGTKHKFNNMMTRQSQFSTQQSTLYSRTENMSNIIIFHTVDIASLHHLHNLLFLGDDALAMCRGPTSCSASAFSAMSSATVASIMT